MEDERIEEPECEEIYEVEEYEDDDISDCAMCSDTDRELGFWLT